MSRMKFPSILATITLAAAALAASAPGRAAMDEPAKPKVDCTNPANKDKPACAAQHGQLSDD